MKTKEEIEKIVEIEAILDKNLSKIRIGAGNSWIDQGRTEGIEIKGGNIITFWIKDNERVYGEPASEKIQKILSAVTSSETTLDHVTPEITATEKQDALTAILPDAVTMPLIEKWKKMSTIERMLLFQKTPPDRIKRRVVGTNADGSKETASYVEGNYMVREANAAFLFDWGLEVKEIRTSPENVAVIGVLRATIDGRIYERPAVGYEEVNKKMTVNLAIKSATTDAIKKGLSLFGFNSDVYGGEV